MKKRNPTIVSVTTTKVDPRESDARNMLMWLKSVPITAIHNPTAYLKIVGEDHRRAVDRLITLADMDFSVTVPGVTKDFLRVRSDEGQFGVTYMEHFPKIENDEEHYSSMCLQIYAHVVDAFRCFQLRIESEQPFKPVRV